MVEALGRKAEIWLKVCDGDKPPIELKLPFEFAAVIERLRVIGNASIGAPLQNGTTGPSEIPRFRTYGSQLLEGQSGGQYYLENPHATLSMNDEFAYINISYGATRIWEEPLAYPIPCRLGNLGAGSRSFTSGYRIVGEKEPRINANTISGADLFRISGGYYVPAGDTAPRYIKDCFAHCQTFVVRLPTEKDRTLTIVASQLYQRGETITLTANSPDTEFDQKFLIFDFRTDKKENIPAPPGTDATIKAPWQNPSQEYAGFGGLPALIQFPFRLDLTPLPPETIFQYMPKFYKPQNTWTKMDWLHHQLQESPKVFAPLNTVLPLNVFAFNTLYENNIIFDLDGKFGRSGRAEKISNPSAFGNSTYYNPAPTYTGINKDSFPHLISFKEQLIGSGLIKDNKLLKWYRIATSSFPILGQIGRNP